MSTFQLPDWLQSSWKGPRVQFTLPPSSFFRFPPSSIPAALPPPPDNPALAHPFTIPSDLYNAALSPNVPITIALVYATTITYLNRVNARRNNKPWAISQTRLFSAGVLLHNLVLAAYSAWTCVGMINDLRIVYEHWSGPHGFAGTVDSLCKLHGPRGLGSAAVHNSVTSQWSIANKAYHLSSAFLPESSDVGRIWNEGLAFYGWLFYLSKFYEVIDTLIIIAKGKKSSFLQTYHHAGAMMCMWAGIRYMSPPIWMFVLVNSFIHAVMYTFYFCTALRIKVPKPLKQTLTTLQITQFIVGASYAFLHFFIKYQIPISTPYVYHLGKKIVEGASSLGADAASEFTSAMAAATASADTQAWLKKLALRAAGREGLAENVLNAQGNTFGVDAVHAVKDFVQREEVRYRDELTWVNCLDTSGQAFAIYLNLIYLLPLTGLFVRFFINSYIRRSEVQRRRSISDRVSLAGQSFGDARRGVGRRLSEAFEDTQGWNGGSNGEQVVIDGEKVRKQLRELDEKMRKKADESAVEMPHIDEVYGTIREGAEKSKSKVVQAATSTKESLEDVRQSVSESTDTSMDVEDVLKKAWASVDSSKGKSATQHTMSSSTTEVSSTTVFESSSISRSSQDEVISSSKLVRDADVDTKTGNKKKAVPQNSSTPDTSLYSKTTSDMTESSPVQHLQENQDLFPSSDISSDSSVSEQDPYDEFSQTRPTSASTHSSPVKATSTSSSTQWYHKFPVTKPIHHSPTRSNTSNRSISPTKIPAPAPAQSQHQHQNVQVHSRKWHSRRRGHDIDSLDSSQILEDPSSPTASIESQDREPRKIANAKRDEIEDVTREKGDDNTELW